MARAERPLDDEESPLGSFAADLRRLRTEAGSPPYREVSRRAHYSPAALSDAASGRLLPSLAVALAYVAACGGDTVEWERRWHVLAAELAEAASAEESVDGDTEKAPYAGLAVFQPEDAAHFFGRERLVADLTARVASQRFVVVIGPSGSGKSSLLRAGLVHRVRTRGLRGTPGAPVVTFSPGAHPLEECAARLAALTSTSPGSVYTELRTDPGSLHLMALLAMTGRPSDADLVLVVDQFEEVFTLCQDPEERARFLQVLRTAADAPNSRTRIVVGVRADFYGRCVQHPELLEALRTAQVPVGPMNTEELRSAVTQPALNAGLRVETGLVAQVIADATGYPGVLPLLSHALLETWRRRRGTTLTLAGYIAIGGITQSIARTAETVYTALSQRQQQWARELFIRLVALGDGTEDTKRRLPRGELELADPDHTTVVERLAQARLLVLDRDSVEIAHESLIRCWPRLQRWLSTDREGVRIHRQLTEAASTWESLHRDPGALYRGSRLAQADQWAGSGSHGALTTREREFLSASLAFQTAEQTTARRRTRRLRQLLVVLAALLVVAVASTGYASYAQHTAIDQRNDATAQNTLNQAAALNTTDSALALQLGLAAYRIAPSANTRSTLFSMMAAPFASLLTVPDMQIASIALNPNGRLLATADYGSSIAKYDVRLWDASDSAHPRWLTSLASLPGPASRVAFSPDGHTLAIGTVDPARRSVVRFWDVSDPQHPREGISVSGSRGEIANLAFSPDGRTLAVGVVATATATGGMATYDNEITLWDLADPRHPQASMTLTGSSKGLPVAAFSAEGHLLATSGVAVPNEPGTSAGADVTWLWNVSDPQRPEPTTRLPGTTGTLASLVFRPDGRILATSDITYMSSAPQEVNRREVRLWNVSDPHHPEAAATLTGTANSTLQSAAFSPDNRTLATINTDRSIRLWDVTDPGNPAELATLAGSTQVLRSVVFSPDGHTLVDNTGDSLRLEDVSNYTFPARTDSLVGGVGIRSDGRVLAAGHDGTVDLWDIVDPNRRRLLSSFTVADTHVYVPSVQFSPDGHVLAVENLTSVTFWDVTDPRSPREMTTPASSPVMANSMVLSPDGHILATENFATAYGISGKVQLWDIANPRQPRGLASFTLPGVSSEPMAFSPNAHTLAVAAADGAVRLWDVTDPHQPHALGSPIKSTSVVNSVAYSPDGRDIAVGTNGRVALWDVSDPRHPRQDATITTSTTVVYSIAYRTDGHVLAVGSANGTVALWDVSDPRHPQQDATITTSTTNFAGSLAFSPDNGTLAVGGGNYPQLLETDIDHAAARICELAGSTINASEWDQYLPGIPYQPPCRSSSRQ